MIDTPKSRSIINIERRRLTLCIIFHARKILILFVLTVTPFLAVGQIVWGGLKAGVLVNYSKPEDDHFKDTVNVKSGLGYSVGGAVLFKVKDRYFLHTEYIYSTRSKIITGKIDRYLKDRVTYHYFEIPILFSIQFKSHFGRDKNFKFFLGAGPNIAYMLSGKGVIESGELIENGISSISYKIKFKRREDRDHNDIVYYPRANKLQFGINLGMGFVFEPVPKHKIVVDLRYCFDQTRVGKGSADYLIPHDYDDNLKYRNKNFRLSFMYLLEYNLNKKVRNRGKSTIKFK